MRPVVVITEKEFCKGQEVFESCREFICKPASLHEDALAEAILENSAFAAIVGVDAFRDELYTALPNGGVIARFGVGHDGIDKIKATNHGLFVTNTPGVLDDSVAEYTVLLIGSFARHIGTCHRDMKCKKWQPSTGLELRGKTLLIIGCGSIGRKTAKIATFGFGMQVVGYDVASLNAEELNSECGIQRLFSDIQPALSAADFISLHIPSTPTTYHFVDSAFLGKVEPTGVLINTARGSLVDEIALYDTLKANQIAGAALDVFENEPFVPIDPQKDLRSLDNILLTPHIASSTIASCRRMALSCLASIQAAYEKRYRDLNLLNPEVLEQ